MESRLDSISKHIENDDEVEFERSLEEMLSTLPKGNSWGNSESLVQYQGFWFFPGTLKRLVSGQQRFQAQPTDIMLCSSPNRGTTWSKSIVFSIVTRTCFDGSSPLLSKTPHEVVPSMEFDHDNFWFKFANVVELVHDIMVQSLFYVLLSFK
ncbi:cytosolic sulfotransferase 18-like [Hibiscus syriacus]|uniref:cytosolic sulfotransferase 18-like n=1 Tax=Hibiscus syriacus TaxID=106335 RepID=UPI0019232A13|nr:cytosolic sulfotransferase 18-like [Hibiscus syriacus]